MPNINMEDAFNELLIPNIKADRVYIDWDSNLPTANPSRFQHRRELTLFHRSQSQDYIVVFFWKYLADSILQSTSHNQLILRFSYWDDRSELCSFTFLMDRTTIYERTQRIHAAIYAGASERKSAEPPYPTIDTEAYCNDGVGTD